MSGSQFRASYTWSWKGRVVKNYFSGGRQADKRPTCLGLWDASPRLFLSSELPYHVSRINGYRVPCRLRSEHLLYIWLFVKIDRWWRNCFSSVDHTIVCCNFLLKRVNCHLYETEKSCVLFNLEIKSKKLTFFCSLPDVHIILRCMNGIHEIFKLFSFRIIPLKQSNTLSKYLYQ